MSTELIVKDTPLLMKGPLVCATLDDLKTQTRRLNGLDVINSAPDSWDYIGYTGNARHMFRRKDGSNPQTIKCPYGKPGDRLWVRETIRATPEEVYYDADRTPINLDDLEPEQEEWIHAYKGDVSDSVVIPSIHMPRWASRINLEIAAIRVERVQDISIPDTSREGIPWNEETNPKPRDGRLLIPLFAKLWDSINAKRGYPWKDNNWVWVVEFKRVTA